MATVAAVAAVVVATDITAHLGGTAITISPLLPPKSSKPKSIIDELIAWS